MKAEVIAMLAGAQRVLAVTHRDPDGDALGSALGLLHLLEARGAQVRVHAHGEIPPEYEFLPDLERVSSDLPPRDWVETAVLLDCHEPQRAGRAAEEMLAGCERTAVVDHHQGRTDFGAARWVDPSYAATSVMLAEAAFEAGWDMNPRAAACLFVGLQTDTGSFRYSNAGVRAFETAARLVAAGADPWAISQEVYATRPQRVRLFSWVLERLDMRAGGRLALGCVSRRDLDSLGCDSRDLENMVEMIRAIPGVEAAVLLKENKSGGVKASMRSRGLLDVAEVAISFGGGGHHNAAGMTLDLPLDQAAARLADILTQRLEESG